jgi:hypothetical protein
MAADFLREAGGSGNRLTVQFQERVTGLYARSFARPTGDDVLDGWRIRGRILRLGAIRRSDHQADNAVAWKIVVRRGTGAPRIGSA